MSAQKIHVGIDVSKASLDITYLQTYIQKPNTPKGIQQLITTLKTLSSPVHLVVEATGGYEQSLMEACWKASLLVSRVDPRKVRHYAFSEGILAKTDKIDSKVIRDFAEKKNLIPSFAPDPSVQALQAFVKRRVQILEMIKSENNQLEHVQETKVKSSHKKIIAFLEKQLQVIDLEMKQTIQNHSHLKAKSERLNLIQGIGPVLSSTLLALMPELGSITSNQAATLAGVAPLNHDSGNKKGQRRIQAGRSLLRSCLYMGAVVAARCNPVLSKVYQRLIAKGKKPKVALVALMRKLICVANHLLKNPSFNPIKSTSLKT